MDERTIASTADYGRDRPNSIARFLGRHRSVDLPTDWSGVIGHDHAKRELRVVAESLRRRDLAERLGLPLVKGILITGPAGTGKTLLARVFAGSLERPVFLLSASDLTAGRIRRLYAALADEPCVVVIDEIDLVAPRSYGHNTRPRTVGALCVALDGLKPVSGPITIGLTAEPIDELDPSIVRSGRLTTKVILEIPTRVERVELWRAATGPIPTRGRLDVEEASDRSEGMTGADIAATALTAAGLALADGLEALDQAHLDEALERRGVVRRRPTDDVLARRATAIHEAGHVVLAFVTFGPSAVSHVVISRTGRGEGHMSLRREWSDGSDLTGHRWRDEVRLALAGLVAERVVEGPDGATLGSHHDVADATGLVLRAAEHGLLSRLGPVSTDRVERGPDGEAYEPRGSEAMRAELWSIVRDELRHLESETQEILARERDAIIRLADALLAAGTLSGAGLLDALRHSGATEMPR
jgi:cell division protease FtsH